MRKLVIAIAAAAVPFALASAALAAKPAAKPAAKAAAGDTAAGKKVYEARCASCHGALAAKKPTLPQAADFFHGKYRLTGGDPKKIAKVIKEGAAKAFPGKGSAMMAPVPLSDKERADVIAFVKTLGK